MPASVVNLVLAFLALLSMSPAHASMFTLRPGASLYQKPSYKLTGRLELSADQILVEGPSLDQQGAFCLYRLYDKDGKPLIPETAWTPCYNIDKLFDGN